MTTVAQFEIHHTRYMDENGNVLKPLPAFARSRGALVDLYRALVLTRTFDAKAIALQRTGRLGTYASSLGQEAVGVGIGDAMYSDDVLIPSFREHGAQLRRGVTLVELFQYWGGDERGSDYAGPREDFPISVTVGGHAPHAAGVGLAFKLRRESRAAVCVFGDGATSKGDVYEAMNIAGTWHLPVVFIVNNNGWAISMPRREQTAALTLAQKAIAAGFEGEQVDGNDLVAVRETTRRAVDKARAGDGPHLIECLTYRLGDHTTADDASRYRDDAEVSRWWQRDPVARLRTHLTHQCHWTRDDEETLLRECGAEVDSAADAYLNLPKQPPQAIFDYLFASLPRGVKAQRDALGAAGGGGRSGENG
ncbi:MAG: pyruvate dehydrogenase (acetyl-transferring) E1 component subunit alpha [Gammaproteobacteria bacterium]|jgi:2-oxoisovalerate dehydrogenase E1 component alpha subunit